MSYLKHKPGSIEELAANEASKLNDNAYQDMFKKELDKAGKGIGGMSPKEKKDFFNKIDDKYKAKNEETLEEKKNYKYNSNFFVNDKTDTLKKFNGRRDYNKSTLTDYLAQKTNKKEDDVYFDDTELVYKDKTVLKNAETKTVAQMLQALKTIRSSYGEEKDVPKGSHKMPDGTIMKDSEHKKEVKEEDAYDNDRFIIKNGKATVDNSDTADNKDHVHAPNAKIALQLHKQGKKVYKEELSAAQKKLPAGLQKAIKDKEAKSESLVKASESVIRTWEAATHKMPDGTIMKGAKHKDETKDETKDEANDVDNGDEKKDTKKKLHADSGSKLTKVETEPSVDYKN